MRDVKHIPLPTDFSDNSRSAIPAAVSWARRTDAVLHFLHVVTPLPWPAHRVMEEKRMPMLNAEIRRRCERRLRDLVSETGDTARCEIHVAEGSPAEQVERFVAEHRIDLIAISTQGHTGLKRFALGSTTEKIVRTAPCPVLVVRHIPATWDEVATIVAPTDFSELSKLAVEETSDLARQRGARILLVHVLEQEDYPIGSVLEGHGVSDFEEQARKGARERLELVQQARVDPTVHCETAVREGVPSTSIADLAEEEHADLIVIATHGREGLARFVLGSTAERVVRIAPCSVLVVKQRAD